MSKSHVVIYSHGFGVRQDDRGMFTDIAATLPNARHIMFDYNEVDEATGNLTVLPLNEQAEKLRQVMAETRDGSPNAIIDLIAHSQGCIVACLADLEGVRKAIFIGPPAKLSVDDMVRIFTARSGSEINLHGVSRLQRADFSTTTVPPKYWKSIEGINPVALYNNLSKTTPLTLMNATDDEVIGNKDFSGLSSKIKVMEIKTGHNFEGEGRQQLINAVKQELNNGPADI